jgi:hypothetical protein
VGKRAAVPTLYLARSKMVGTPSLCPPYFYIFPASFFIAALIGAPASS